MQERLMDKHGKSGLLCTRGLWICVLAGVVAIAAAVRPGAPVGAAQAQPPGAQAHTVEMSAASGTGGRPALPDRQVAKQETSVAGAGLRENDPRKKQIADQSADLLRLANSLKAEVDKSTELSQSSKTMYIDFADCFVRWMYGGFKPGSRGINPRMFRKLRGRNSD